MLAKKKTFQENNYYLEAGSPALFADVYQEPIQLINWQRDLSKSVQHEVEKLLANKHSFTFRVVLPPDQVAIWLQEQWGETEYNHLAQDVQMLTTLFADLFETAQVGLRFELVDKTLCPSFHVDKVLCRLVTTYHGRTTEWLEDSNTNRQALRSHLYDQIVIDPSQINHVSVGDVLLFKGQSWSGNEGEGVVHRSSQATPEQRRLLLTLDIVG